MPNLVESPEWEAGIYQLEITDPVEGGEGGISNLQQQQLANRTAYLKQQLESEVLERGTADADLQTQIDEVLLTVDSAITAIDTEISDRESAIAAIVLKSFLRPSSQAGTSNEITTEFLPAITALTDTTFIIYIPTAANTISAVTFKAGTIIEKPIVKSGGALAPFDLRENIPALLHFNTALNAYVLLNPARGQSPGISAWQDITAGVDLSFAHGLPYVPNGATVLLKNAHGTDCGYVFGNILEISTAFYPIVSYHYGVQVRVDGANIHVTQGANGISIFDTSGSIAIIDVSKWQMAVVPKI